MSTNKHALIRYRTLDKCFANRGRKFFMKNLIEACNKAINDFTLKQTKIQGRQILDDVILMESTEGYSIPLDRISDNRKTYYRQFLGLFI